MATVKQKPPGRWEKANQATPKDARLALVQCPKSEPPLQSVCRNC